MDKRLLAIAMLFLAALSCSIPGRPVTPSGPDGGEIPSETPTAPPAGPAIMTDPTLVVPPEIATPQPLSPQYPLITVPIRAFQVMDDDEARPAAITAQQVSQWVEHANQIFAGAGIQFTFNPDQDFDTLRSTLLSNMTGKEDPNWIEAITYGDAVAADSSGRLVVFFRHGPGETPTGGGFSWYDYNFVAMPGFDTDVCGYQNIGMLAHEIGHYLGLWHTFDETFASEQEAEDFLSANGNDPLVFDGDGFADTPPDPYVEVWAIQCQPVDSIELGGMTFPLPRTNIMSYYEVRTGLSQQQIERVRYILSLRMQNYMAMPTNRSVPFPVEADSLTVTQSTGCWTSTQIMEGFGGHQWYEGDQLFVGADANCVLDLSLPVAQAGRYRIGIYLTRAPDFGQIRVSLDGAPLASTIDAYAPLVLPSGPIALGEIDLTAGNHTLTIEVVGQNAESSGYSFGLDCLSLSPIP